MKKQIFIEGVILLVLSVISLTEAGRLVLRKSPDVTYDAVGPGLFPLLLTVALIATGIIHILVNFRKDLNISKEETSEGIKLKTISMVAILASYIYLIEIIGYIMATIMFFLIIFRIAGIKSWIFNVIITLVCTGLYYFVFIECCNVIFPKGIFFE